MNIDNAKTQAMNIPGWLTQKEGELLFRLAKACTRRGVIVEIGSFKGRSTVLLGLGSKSGHKAKVYAIDPHTFDMDIDTLIIPKDNRGTLHDFLRNIKEASVEDIVVPVNKLSKDALNMVKGPLELLFIDGDHEYEAVKLDFLLWSPRLSPGGIVAFHDNKCPGPKRVIEEYLKKGNFIEMKSIDSITYAKKKPK